MINLLLVMPCLVTRDGRQWRSMPQHTRTSSSFTHTHPHRLYTHQVMKASSLTKISTVVTQRFPLSVCLGVLGMPGATAYFGLLRLGRPKAGETVVVSSGSGAVGAVVGHIAKHVCGCIVVGIAGTEEKVAYMKEELGFDAGINYNACGDMGRALDAACPHGIDVYFENVGGSIGDAAIARMNKRGRGPVCGCIDSYNLHEEDERRLGPRVQGERPLYTHNTHHITSHNTHNITSHHT